MNWQCGGCKVREPRRATPSPRWKHYQLWRNVRETLPALPAHFRSVVQISGISATEIYTFGSVLSATIEEELVRALNELRRLWDPDNQYPNVFFERQSQRFPDVLLVNRKASQKEILFGIELKSWYLLAKEGEPSFRFTITPDACTRADLIVIVPWALSYVVAGSPIIFPPYVEQARFIAEYRNYWWQNLRRTEQDSNIITPQNPTPYPEGREQVCDVPVSDSGRNFGRIARIGLMDEYIHQCFSYRLLGIPLREWQRFFRNALQE